MIKSSKISIKFANQNKIDKIEDFIKEYKNVTQQFVDILWNSYQNKEHISSLIPKTITSKINSWISKRTIQCAAKQASGIVRGTIKKQKQRDFIIKKLNNEGKFRKARKLFAKFQKNKISKPELKEISPELDSRFIKISQNNNNSFELWITIVQLGKKFKISIPLNKTKHFNKLNELGKIKSGIRISNKMITFMFDLPEVPKRTSGEILGIDIGAKTVLSCSNNFQTQKDKDGYDLDKIQKKLSKRIKGSKGFKKAQEHRKNYVNWSINQLDLKNIKQINIEDIKDMRKGIKSSRYLSHFIYSEIFGKLESVCEQQGVLVVRKSPTYTSQRCSECGWVRKSNRKGKLFKCTSCGFACDADLNASRNIVLELPEISKEVRLSHSNKKGFYWNVLCQKPIVSDARRV